MLEDILLGLSAAFAIMAVPAFIWPRRFSPCAPGLNHLHFLAAFLWLKFAAMFFCWRATLRFHAVYGWTWQVAVAALLAAGLTGIAIQNYRDAQKVQLYSPYKFAMLKKIALAGWPGMDKEEILRHIDDLARTIDEDLKLLYQCERQKPGSNEKAIANLNKVRNDITRLRMEYE